MNKFLALILATVLGLGTSFAGPTPILQLVIPSAANGNPAGTEEVQSGATLTIDSGAFIINNGTATGFGGGGGGVSSFNTRTGAVTLSTADVNAVGPLTLNLTGNVTGNVSGSAGSFSGALAGDVTGTQGATTVVKFNGVSPGVANGPVITDSNNYIPYLPWYINQDGISLVCDGDSITFGAGVTTPGTQAWPSLLALSPFFGSHLQTINSNVATGGAASGQANVNLVSASSFSRGQVISSPSAAAGLTVSSVSSNTITLSGNLTGTITAGTPIVTSSAYNTGVSGSTIPSMISRYAASVKPFRPTANGGTGGPASYLVFLGGTNDLGATTTTLSAPAASGTNTLTVTSSSSFSNGNNLFCPQIPGIPSGTTYTFSGTTVTLSNNLTQAIPSGTQVISVQPVATVIASASSYTSTALADGFFVILQDLLPNGGYSYAPSLAAYNSAIKSGQVPCSAIADTESALPDANSTNAGTWYLTNLHPTPAGNVLIANYLSNGFQVGGWAINGASGPMAIPEPVSIPGGITGETGITDPSTATSRVPWSVFQPGLPSGFPLYTYYGQSNSPYNSAVLGFNFGGGPGSTANYQILGLDGGRNPNIDGLGNLSSVNTLTLSSSSTSANPTPGLESFYGSAATGGHLPGLYFGASASTNNSWTLYMNYSSSGSTSNSIVFNPNGTSAAGSISFSIAGAVTAPGGYSTPGLITGTGTAPAIAAGAAAGSSPTVSLTGSNIDGDITITTGTSTTTGTLATVTLAGSLAYATHSNPILTPENANAASLYTTSAPYCPQGATTNFTISTGATAPAASTTYTFHYFCPGY